MNFSTKIEALIVEIEKELGVDRGFPVTIELAKAALAARKLEAVQRCDSEIAKAQAEANKPHTEMEHAGIAIWECDWLSERQRLLEEKA